MNAVVTESLPENLRSWIKPGDVVRVEFACDLPDLGRYVGVFVDGVVDAVMYTRESSPYFAAVA